jgi:hypothetical protein
MATRRRRIKSIDLLRKAVPHINVLHNASYSLTETLNEKDVKVLINLIDLYCKDGCIGQIHFLGRFLWYRCICCPSNYVGVLGKNTTVQSPLLAAAQKDSLACFTSSDNTFMANIADVLSTCHINGLPWPPCVLKALLCAIVFSTTNKKMPQVVATKKFVDDDVLQRICSRLLIMGLIRPDDSSMSCFQTCNLDLQGERSTKERYHQPWKLAFAQCLSDMLYLDGAVAGDVIVRPSSFKEHTLALCMLPTLLSHLKNTSLIHKLQLSPFTAHCRLLECSDIPKTFFAENDDSFPFTEAKIAMFHAQVLWKRRCCEVLTQRNHSYATSNGLKRVGLSLLPQNTKLAFLCLKESRHLQVKHLAETLGGISNALQYMGLVLWSISGKDSKGKGNKKLCSNCLLSRRCFSIRKQQTSQPLDEIGFAEWYESLQHVLQDTKKIDAPDVKYVHGRLAWALCKFDLVRSDIHETDALLDGHPNLIEE